MSEREPFGYVRDWKKTYDSTGWWHSFELPDGTVIQGAAGLDGLKLRLAQFPIPADLRGKRVLDIGAWDGWFTFEMERRGAEVLAIDVWDNPRFREMRHMLGSRADYRQMDVYELDPKRIGRFDIVLFMGVLYHLKHPLLALERVCSVTSGMAAVDSFVLRDEPGTTMRFYELDEMGGQTDNWVAPSLSCLLAFCRTAGFARVNLLNVLELGACIACYRQWEPVPDKPAEPEPVLLDAYHPFNYGINFESARDEYVTCWFDSPVQNLTLDDVKPDVGGYGVRPIHVSRTETGHWQTNFKLPLGLDAGWHDVTMRTRDSGASEPRRLALDVPAEVSHLEIVKVADSSTWTLGRIDLRSNDVLALWIDGLPDNADRGNLAISVGGERASIIYAQPADIRGPRQVNVRVPAWVPMGSLDVAAKIGSVESAPVPLEVVR